MGRPLAALAASLPLLAGAAGYELRPVDLCFSRAGSLVDARAAAYPIDDAELAPALKEAIAACEVAVRDEPRRGAAHAAYAEALVLAGDLEKARAEAQLARDTGWQHMDTLLASIEVRGRGMPADAGPMIESLKRDQLRGSVFAAYDLGLAYGYALGVPADEAQAYRYFRGAAGSGSIEAMVETGNRLARGIGAGRDVEEAHLWWRRAADALAIEVRPQPAQWARPVPLDASMALAWWREQANAGNASAQTFLGLLHERGVWVARDYTAARAWYERAAAQAYAPAELRIAMMYSMGRGVAKDYAESRRWGSKGTERTCEAAVQANAITPACDRYAGDPFDPAHVGPGIPVWCMPFTAKRAHEACTSALRAAPGNARLRGQLARALAHEQLFVDARREATRAAAGGSTTAMALLGMMDELGYEGPKDQESALRWYLKAGEKGDERALRHAARVYEAQGRTQEARELASRIPPRINAAPDLLEDTRRRAEAGQARAQHDLAWHYESQQDYANALAWYRKAAAQGWGASQLNLAQMYELGLGVERDPAEALKLYRKPAEAGGAEARWHLAMLAWDARDYGESLTWLRRLAADNDLRAVTQIGIAYEEGRGVGADAREALKWYDRAAAGSAWAATRAGVVRVQGDEGVRDYALARRDFERGAAGDNAAAMNNLGVMHERGLGIPADAAAAADWYLKALARGSSHGAGNLQALYDSGRGAPREAAQAIAWYRRGADAGVPAAQFRLAEAYERPGTTQDRGEALRWYLQDAGEVRALQAAARLVAAGTPVPGVSLDRDPRARALFVALIEQQAARIATHPRTEWLTGFDADAGEDARRKVQVRVARGGSAQAAAMDTSWSVIIAGPGPKAR